MEQIVTAVRGQLEAEAYESVPAGLGGDVEIFLDELSANGMIALSSAES